MTIERMILIIVSCMLGYLVIGPMIHDMLGIHPKVECVEKVGER